MTTFCSDVLSRPGALAQCDAQPDSRVIELKREVSELLILAGQPLR
jgi:hypothetical protein